VRACTPKAGSGGEPGRTPLTCEIVCRPPPKRAAHAATFALPIRLGLSPPEQAWLAACTGRASHYALTVMHVHHRRVSLSRTLSGSSQPPEDSLAMGIGRCDVLMRFVAIAPGCAAQRTAQRYGGRAGIGVRYPPSQVRATMSTWWPPIAGSATPRGPRRGGIGSALEARTDPG
jgi:hypothetical protein